MTILLVEDEQDLQEMYRLQLEHGGHRVRIAADAQAALDVLDKQPIRLILLDIMLPVHNGLSVLHELRSYSDWRQIPVIILSNVKLEELGLSEHGLKAMGVVGYLEKAHTKPSQILEAVAKV